MGLWSLLFRARSGGEKLNADPVQREFADELIAAADTGDIFQMYAVKVFVDSRGWSPEDKELRLAHALNIVKVMRPDLYKEAKNIGFKHVR
ncbi:MAG: hypothetical protein Q8M24_00075 [Pseudolabrys sp.]|nr:hypothetical protein [Pseudolabrys sp.]MDP2293844.1 hypothetical protein [Pseudolabrys sp.]